MQGLNLYKKCTLGCNMGIMCLNLVLGKVLEGGVCAGVGNCIKEESKGILDAFLPLQMALETGGNLGTSFARKKLTFSALQNLYKNYPKFPIGFLGSKIWFRNTTRITSSFFICITIG